MGLGHRLAQWGHAGGPRARGQRSTSQGERGREAPSRGDWGGAAVPGPNGDTKEGGAALGGGHRIVGDRDLSALAGPSRSASAARRPWARRCSWPSTCGLRGRQRVCAVSVGTRTPVQTPARRSPVGGAGGARQRVGKSVSAMFSAWWRMPKRGGGRWGRSPAGRRAGWCPASPHLRRRPTRGQPPGARDRSLRLVLHPRPRGATAYGGPRSASSSARSARSCTAGARWWSASGRSCSSAPATPSQKRRASAGGQL